MIVLAVDTTSRQGSCAVLRGGELIVDRPMTSADGFGSVLYQEIDETLKAAGLKASDVDLFAAASGPGSFTGIRVGLTAVKALAEAFGKPVAGVSNLEALALAGSGERRAAVLDGRRGEVFAAVYDAEGRELIAEGAFRWPDFLERARSLEPQWLATNSEVFGESGAAALPESADRRIIPTLARWIGQAAAAKAAKADHAATAGLDANYVRRPDAERNWRAP